MIKKIAILFFLLVVFIGCGGTGEPVRTEPPFPQEAYDEAIRKGDEAFATMHLYGWRKADEYYARAYGMKQTPELRDKRFLCLCLTAIREKDERIVNPAAYEKLDALGEFEKTPRQKYFTDLLKHYRTAPLRRNGDPKLRAKEKREVDISLFDIQNSALDAYLYLYFLEYYSYDFAVPDDELAKLFKEHRLFVLPRQYADALSPLFLYSNFKSPRTTDENIETRYPGFAEFFLKRGNRLFRENRLKQAAVYFRRVLELLPDYTTAITGMGNIYYFTVKDYETAIGYYDKTLALDPLNPISLFGKAVSLHFLKRFDESDVVLDIMLEKQRKHHGEAYYYKAYNCFLKEQQPQAVSQPRAAARPLIDKAKTLLPRSGEVHFLSGLLYFNEGDLEAAEKDFNVAIDDYEYSNCQPLYYLGMIQLKQKKWGFFRDFDQSIRCLESRVQGMEQRIRQIGAMELGEREKEWMKADRGRQLAAFKESSRQLTEQMTAIIAKNKDKKKKYDSQVKNSALSKVKTLLAKDPGQLNKPDREGSTLLHKAVENGQPDVARFLIAKGARLDIPNSLGYLPLHWAVMLGQAKIVSRLIRAGADVTAGAADGMTPLHDAAHGGRVDIVRLLLRAGADPYAQTDKGKTPLDLAVDQRKTAILPLLKPIHTAVETGNAPGVETLLAKNKELLEAPDEDGNTPLNLAAAGGHKDLAWRLLNRGADIDARNHDGYSPLMTARQNGHADIAHMLTARGAAPGDDEVLKQPLEEKQAVIWRLNQRSWAVKTRTRFLVFNYEPMPHLYQYRAPKALLLSNGHIGPRQLKEQRVAVFVGSRIVNHRDPGLPFSWRRTIPAIDYIYGWPVPVGDAYTLMDRRMKKDFDGMEVVSIKAVGGGAGFLVNVDGLTVLYPAAHFHFDPAKWEAFTAEIDYLSQHAPPVDIAFLPLPTDIYQEKEMLLKGVHYVLETLRPKVMFPLPYGMGELPVKAFTETLTQKGITTIVKSYQNRGDRFH